MQTILLKFIRSDYVALAFIVPVFAILLFYYKVQTPFPNIPAGLYALMGETVAGNGFSLPATIPYYGPGGIPFVYPPLSFYIMAFFLTYLKVNSFDYMRFAPSLFLLLSLVPMYLLAKEMTASPRQAAIATCLFGTSYGIVVNHYYPPGLCRGIALLFMLFCIYFAYKTFFSSKLLFAVAASLFLALTILSHLSYAVFGIVSIITFALLSKQMPFWRRIFICCAIGIGSLVVASPWWLTIISRHEFHTFINAFRTHDVTSVFHVFDDFPGRFVVLINSLLTYRFENPILIGAAILGIAFCMATNKFLIPGWLLISVMVMGGDGQRFIAIISSILGAVAVENLLLNLPELPWKEIKLWQRNIIIFIVFFILIIVSAISAFFLRFGSEAGDYTKVILVFMGASLIAKLSMYYYFDIFSRTGRAPLLAGKEIRNIFISITIASIISSVVAMLLLYPMKLIVLRVPNAVLALDWVLTIILMYGFYAVFYKLHADDVRYLPTIIFLLVLGIGSYVSQPTLFYIDSAKTKTFFNSVLDMSQWLGINTPANTTYLMVSEDSSYQLPGILRYDDEWFPYLLKRTPVVCPYGAEWTGDYDRQQSLLADIHNCSQMQSWICLETFMKANQINPDLLIVHKHDEPYSIYRALYFDENWHLIYENQEYAIWQP